MNKLGFAIKLASAGAGNVIECNKGAWTSKVVDIREYLNLFTGLQGTDNIVTFISFDEEGCFLTQLRAISGRAGDFLSGWIYIPSAIDITDEEVINAYNYVRNLLSLSNLVEVKNEINQFFDRAYITKNLQVRYLPSRGEKFGVRYFGKYNLKEIVGSNRYQPIYANYRAVFLMEQKDEVNVSADQAKRFENLTNQKIDSLCYLLPPDAAEVHKLGAGAKILCDDKITEFTAAMQLKKGDTKIFYLSRKGFEKIPLQVTMLQESQPFSLQGNNIEWKKQISTSMFEFATVNGTPIEGKLRVEVNGQELGYKPILLTEAECSRAVVSVTSNDFEPYKKPLNLLLAPSTIIHLTRKTKSSNYKIEMSNGDVAKFTLETKHLPDGSPLTAYDYDPDYPDTLCLSSWFVWKQRLIGFLGTIVMALVIALCVLLWQWADNGFGNPFGGDDTTENTDSVQEGESGENESTLTPEDSVAWNYINGQDKWIRDSLELYPLTQGLYDRINDFKFDELVNNNIPGCEKLEDIKEVAKRAYDANVQMPHDSYSLDGSITVSKWIDAVNKEIEKKNVDDTKDESANNKSDENKDGVTSTSGNAGTGKGQSSSGKGQSNSGKGQSGSGNGQSSSGNGNGNDIFGNQ